MVIIKSGKKGPVTIANGSKKVNIRKIKFAKSFVLKIRLNISFVLDIF